MRAGTHYAFAYLILQLSSPETTELNLALACAALLPDIDHPEATIGKGFPFLSRWIKRKWGHRRITHSFWAILAVALLSLPVAVFYQFWAWVGGVIAFSSHPLIDMLNKGKVFFLYPVVRFKAFGSKFINIRTGSKWEYLILFGFLLGGFAATSQNLSFYDVFRGVRGGLWQSWEPAWADYQRYSPAVMHAEIESFDDRTKEKISVAGPVLYMSESEITLLETRQVFKKDLVSKIILRPTEKKLQISKKSGFNLADLNRQDRVFYSGFVILKNIEKIDLGEARSIKIRPGADETMIELLFATPAEITPLFRLKREIEAQKTELMKSLPAQQIKILSEKIKDLEEDLENFTGSRKDYYANLAAYNEKNEEIKRLKNRLESLKLQGLLNKEIEQKIEKLSRVSASYDIFIYQFGDNILK